MYFITATIATIISALLWFFFKDRKGLHLDILTIVFGAATLMWLADVIFTAIGGENPFGFEPLDGWISLWTILGGVFFWLVISFVLNNKERKLA